MGTNFQYSKTLAMEGSILTILGLVPSVGWVLGIIGIILLLRALKEFANYYQDNEIYQNALTGVKYYIVALIALAVAGAGFIVGFVLNDFATMLVNRRWQCNRNSSRHRISNCHLCILRSRSHALKKNFQYTRTKNWRTLV